MKDVADLVGYNAKGKIVYKETISIHDYYDGEHPWDDTEQILKLGLTRFHGKLYEADGSVYQEFETAFSQETGKYIGSKATHADGTVNADGIYEEKG